MSAPIHVHITVDPPAEARQIFQELQTMSTILNDVQAQVTALDTKTDALQATIDTMQAGVAAVIAALTAKINAAPSIDDELVALRDQLAAIGVKVDAAAQDAADTPIPAVE